MWVFASFEPNFVTFISFWYQAISFILSYTADVIVDSLDHISFLHSGASMNTFGELFRKYRIKAGFASLFDFADAFAQSGHSYEASIYSHWQLGKRVPRKRVVVVSLVLLLIQRGAIRSMNEANELLESAGHGYLTLTEQEKLRKIVSREFFT